MIEEHISKKSLEPMLDKYTEENYGSDFKFRPQQKEAVLDILEAFFDANCNLYLLEGPTGSGKSITAMIVAGFLSHQKMKGYILTSDLVLQQQYENDFKKYKLDWGSVKGMDNYMCAANSDRFSMGECRLKNTSYEKAEKLPCYTECGYLQSRRKAIKSPVSLLNYSFWLLARNYLEPKMIEQGKGVPFPKRDFTLCDEAHKITDIVQDHFSPRIDDKTLDKLEKLRSVLVRSNLMHPKTTNVRLRTVIRNIFKEENSEKLYVLLKEFELQLLDFVNAGKSIKDHVTKQFPGDMKVPREWKFNLGLVDYATDLHCKMEDYNSTIANTSLDSMIKNPQDDQVIFNCLNEEWMMQKYFHEQCGFRLLLSATLGDPITFLKMICGQNARYFRMQSTFDFSKSPIYFYPDRRMSMGEKDKNMGWMSDKVEDILSKHENDSGIIHTGSYKMTMKIYESLSESNKKRVLIYNGSDEKKEMLEKFMSEKSMILMGPSLLEGLNLYQEKSRLQIFVKIPYPNMINRFVKAKMNYMPEWYQWKTCCSIIQGTGRSIRSDDDYAVTYVLDGCLKDLFNRARKNFTPEFQRRIVVVKD